MSFLPIRNNFSGYNLLLLQNFFKQFLPKSNDKRKYSHNEFSYVYKIVTGIFLHYKKMEISEEGMLHCLNQSGYSIYVADHKSVHAKKENKASVNEKENYDLYISISSGSVLNLKKASGKLAYYHNSSKIAQLHSLKQEISEFFRQADT